MDSTSLLLGAAIGVAGAFGTGFLKKAGEDLYSWTKKKLFPKSVESQHKPQLVVHLNRDDLSKVTHEVNNTTPPLLERINSISLDEINTAIKDAPPLQRDRVAESYIGLKVEWETRFIGGRPRDNNEIRLHLSVEDAKHHPRSVWCEVPINQYRELGIMKEGENVRVSGQIQKIAEHGIDLTDARLQFYRNTPT